MSSISSQVSADSPSDSKPQECEPSLFARLNLTAAPSCVGIGRTCRSMRTSGRSTAGHTGAQSSLFAADTHASPSAWQDEGVARKMKDISGRRCIALFERSGRDGSLPKTLLAILASASMRLPHRWKLKASPSGRLLFQLAPLARRTGETACGLLLTPRAQESGEKQETFVQRMGDRSMNCHGSLTSQLRDMLPTPRAGKQSGKSGEGFSKTLLEALLPTPATSDAKGASTKRFKGSPESHGNLREVLRDGPTDGQYPHPAFVEWMMGFPIGHSVCAPSAMLSSRKSPISSGEPSSGTNGG